MWMKGYGKRKLSKVFFFLMKLKMIQGIALSSRMPKDRQVWASTANGYFSVKSAYNLVVEMSKGFAYGEASDGSNFRKFWKYIWKLNVPHKICHFTWRACKNILPTKDNLVIRMVLSDGCCDKCKSELESSGHSF